MIIRRITPFLALALALIVAPLAEAKKKPKPAPKPLFDYYVFSLSWSPEYCAEKPTDKSIQCAGGRHFAFVVHGLWPDLNSGKHPANCAGPAYDPSFATPEVLAVMPSTDLVQHEWTKHGNCSGLAPKAYFDTILKVRSLITIPADYTAPSRNITTTPAAIRKAFADSNPSFGLTAFGVFNKGKFLQEVRACLTPELKPLPCKDKGDTSTKQVIMRPVR